MDFIANKISKHAGILNRMKKFLPINIMRTLYFSMVQSRLNYALLVWGFDCGRLEKLQKRVIRIITCSKYNSHTEPLFRSLEILKLADLFKINVLKLYFKLKHQSLPSYFRSFDLSTHADIHNYNTRYNTLIPMRVTRTHTALKCIKNYLSIVVNSTPSLILDKIYTHSFKGFMNYAKCMTIRNYSYDCDIVNCYICSR